MTSWAERPCGADRLYHEALCWQLDAKASIADAEVLNQAIQTGHRAAANFGPRRCETDCEPFAHAPGLASDPNDGQAFAVLAAARQNLLDPLSRYAGFAFLGGVIMNSIGAGLVRAKRPPSRQFTFGAPGGDGAQPMV